MNYEVDGIFNQSHEFQKILNSYELENLRTWKFSIIVADLISY